MIQDSGFTSVNPDLYIREMRGETLETHCMNMLETTNGHLNFSNKK